MRRGLLLGVLLAALAPGVAHAVLVGFTAQLTIEIASLSPISDPMPSSGVSNVVGQSFTIPVSEVGAFGVQTLFGSTFFTGFAASVLNTVQGTFAPAGGPGGGFGGVLPLAGTARFQGPGGTLLVFLDALGQGGTLASTAMIGATTVTVSVTGTGWTVGSVSATGYTPMGGALSATNAGFDTPTPSGRQVQLVTPFRIIRREGGGSPTEILPGVARLRVTLLPEPSSIALGLAAAVALVGLARRRARG